MHQKKSENDKNGTDMSHDKIKESGLNIVFVVAVVDNQKIGSDGHNFPSDQKEDAI